MATQHLFNKKLIKLPGAYSRIASGINNPELALSYGNVLVIDTDATSLYGGGSGINGELNSGEDSIYTFQNIPDFRSFVRGGKFWDIAKPLFRPFGAGSLGVSNLHYVRALTTTPAAVTMTTTNGDLTFKTKYEGLVGNGVEVSSKLTKGFATTLSAGISDPAKYVLKFWRGSFTGLDTDGKPFDGILEANSTPELIAQTPEVADIQEIIDWTSENENFINNFTLVSSTAGALTAADLVTFVGNTLFASGTQSSAATSIDDVLTAVTKLDYTHVLVLDKGADAASTDNLKVLAHLVDDAKFEKFMVVAGGDTKAEFTTQSIAAATTLNSHKAIVVHGGCFEQDRLGGSGLRQKDSLHKAAYVLGRVAGLSPQTPPTFKGLGYAGEVHKCTDREREDALDAGVLTTYFEPAIGSFIITQGINTLQANRFVVNEDGTSHQWQLMRIAAQINKELEVNATKDLLGNQSIGPNRATLSEEVVVEFVKSFLSRRTATTTEDNLILSFQDVTVEVKNDAYCINYAFVPNFEVNKLFFTGLIIDPSL